MARKKGSGSIKDVERDAAEEAEARATEALAVADASERADGDFPPEPGDEPGAALPSAVALGDAPLGLDAYGAVTSVLEMKLPRKLTTEERSKRFGEVEVASAALNTAKAEAKASAFEHRDRIKGHEAEIAGLLSDTITEAIRCEVRVDWVGNVRRVIRLDTHAVVEERALSAEDRQLQLAPRPVLVNEEPREEPANILPFGRREDLPPEPEGIDIPWNDDESGFSAEPEEEF